MSLITILTFKGTFLDFWFIYSLRLKAMVTYLLGIVNAVVGECN